MVPRLVVVFTSKRSKLPIITSPDHVLVMKILRLQRKSHENVIGQEHHNGGGLRNLGIRPGTRD